MRVKLEQELADKQSNENDKLKEKEPTIEHLKQELERKASGFGDIRKEC